MMNITDDLKFDKLPEQVLPYERDWFLWMNNSHSDFWDVFMMTYSGRLLWVPLCVVLLFTIFYKTKWQNAVLFILCFVLLATLCDQLSAGVIKPFFSRLRPTHHPDFSNYVLTVDNYRGGRYGFISAHAANAFGVATFLAFIFRQTRFTIVVLVWALLMGYTRIYLGVHFITDILGGMIVGSILGFLIYLLYQFGRAKVLKTTPQEMLKPVYTKKHAYIIIATILLTIGFNIIYSFFRIY